MLKEYRKHTVSEPFPSESHLSACEILFQFLQYPAANDAALFFWILATSKKKQFAYGVIFVQSDMALFEVISLLTAISTTIGQFPKCLQNTSAYILNVFYEIITIVFHVDHVDKNGSDSIDCGTINNPCMYL